MSPAHVEVEKSLNIAMDNEPCYEMSHNDLDFQLLLREIQDPKEKFIVVMYEFGYQKNEIAYMLNVHPSTITRQYRKSCKKIVTARFNNK